MSGLPWVCRRCLTSLRNPLQVRHLRFASTAVTDGTVPPALLNRARLMAAEHVQLSEQIEKSFDTKLAKRVGQLDGVAAALKQLDHATKELSELQALIADPSTEKELKELAADDLTSTEERLNSLSHSLITELTPKHPFADLPCLMEIRPGVGGSEANLFAADLLRMYRAYCSRKGFRVSVLKHETAEGEGDSHGDGPLQEAILEIENAGAYGELRCEAGVHRVQRVPATESKGRTHTSAAAVLVLPSFPTSGNGNEELSEANSDDPSSDYYVNPIDVRIDVMRARGAGGQHVNTTDSAVRLTHVPTGTVVSMQDSRSQHRNREKAWQVLRSRLAQARREAREEEMFNLRKSVIGTSRMGRGDKIRTYNWGQQRVTDHRSGFSVHNLDDVMEGGEGLGKVMESVKTWLAEREIEALLAEEEAKAAKSAKS